MAKYKPIKDTVHIGKANLIRMAKNIITDVTNWTMVSSKDVYSKKFKSYSDGYKKKKGSSKVNLTLSGQMLRSFKYLMTSEPKDNIKVGWTSSEAIQKLIWNESERGKNRQVAKDTGTFPFNELIENKFFNEINKILDKKVSKTSEKVVFRIGK